MVSVNFHPVVLSSMSPSPSSLPISSYLRSRTIPRLLGVNHHDLSPRAARDRRLPVRYRELDVVHAWFAQPDPTAVAHYEVALFAPAEHVERGDEPLQLPDRTVEDLRRHRLRADDRCHDVERIASRSDNADSGHERVAACRQQYRHV